MQCIYKPAYIHYNVYTLQRIYKILTKWPPLEPPGEVMVKTGVPVFIIYYTPTSPPFFICNTDSINNSWIVDAVVVNIGGSNGVTV
jgi:hypothetical protein